MTLTKIQALWQIDHIVKVELPEALEQNDFAQVRILGRTLEDYVLTLELKFGVDIITDVEKEGFLLDIDLGETS